MTKTSKYFIPISFSTAFRLPMFKTDTNLYYLAGEYPSHKCVWRSKKKGNLK